MTTSKPLPIFFVGKDITTQRKDRFMSDKYPALCNALGKEDTRSIWYSREHLQRLLDEIDHANGNGLRIHLGMYESGHEFAGQLCFVMNVTRRIGETGGTVDVILEEEPDFPERSILERSTDPTGRTTRKDLNFGSPCPPRCN